MRRMLAITITLLLGFTLAEPLFAVDTASSLPQCCRRNGLHRCVNGMASGADMSISTVASRCPAFPKATAAPALNSFTLAVARSADTPLFVHPASTPQTEARYRIAFARSRQKRGPPTILL
jgi:hypothetical protein